MLRDILYFFGHIKRFRVGRSRIVGAPSPLYGQEVSFFKSKRDRDEQEDRRTARGKCLIDYYGGRYIKKSLCESKDCKACVINHEKTGF